MNHLRLPRGVDARQRRAEEVDQISQHQSEHHCETHALTGRLVHPVALGRAVVLPHKGDGRLIKGVHGDIDKALNVGAGGGAGHQYRVVEGI